VRRATVSGVITVCLAATVAAQQPPPNQPPAGFTPVNTKLVTHVAGMGKVSVREGVAFKKVDGGDLLMDIYAPPAGGARPAVVLVSGGTRVRDWGLYKDYGRIIGASNLVAVIPDKRYEGQQSMEHGAQDTLDVVAHLRQNAAAYGIDPKRLCLWTFSAGGSLAQVGLDPANGIACVVAFYGLGQAGPKIAMQQHAAAMPPMLLVRAGRDSAGLNNAIDVFAGAALALNAPVTVLNYPNGMHAFEVEDFRPEVRQPANVAQTARILRTTIAWITETVR
jgi:acetyl esterase/lipase